MSFEETIEQIVRRVVREEVREAVRALATASGPGELTAEQAAAALGILPKTLRAWAATGRIQGSKQGRSWRFTPAQVEAARNPTAALADDVLRKLS